ncbi:hypothetical protein ABW20_dc0104878 [Dactylellina cionopaga]|nr:hypothetical protein ABW20_dc0104878 [Dactylellina cionopaga]
MPAKLTHTQEASFLLDIIKHSDLKSINWQAIAEKKQIKKGAAQMRYQRLKQAIEKAEASEAGITLAEGSPSSPNSQSVPSTPKKPRANKVEKPKTPSSRKKIAVNTSMISSNLSMTPADSFSASPMQSVSPVPASIIKMEAQEYMPIHQVPTPIPSMTQAHMAGMPY